MESLTDLIGFKKKGIKARLGEVGDSTILREAIVAVPYIVETIENKSIRRSVKRNIAKIRKKFIEIPIERYDAALSEEKGSLTGDSLDTAGESIRKLVQKMERYILPPQFDFLNNQDVDPIVMYLFEFEYKLDKNDLAYIWQNLAPRDYKKMTLEAQSICHALSINELLEEDNIMDNDNLRWMVFKVKQRSQISYDDMIASKEIFDFTDARLRTRARSHSAEKDSRGSQAAIKAKNRRATTTTDSGYEIGFNWPYDYVSFIEMIKFDVQLLYEEVDEETGHRRRSAKDTEGVWVTAPDMEVSSVSRARSTTGKSVKARARKERASKLLGGD
jgi:hypothetical protein